MSDATPNTNEPRDISDEVESADQLMQRVAALEAQLAEANERNLRLVADYQTSHRRAIREEAQAKLQGMAAVTQSVLSVLDHFDLALKIDTSRATAQQVVDGVRVIRDELMKVLVGHGVGVIHPAQGDPFEPGRHEAVMQQPVDGVGPGLIAGTFQPGYTLSVAGIERVVRPAKVAVTPAV
ncbi:MAG: nucleotide exchange factor GrpE [Phycisphaeraceae bacterium]|nr:MAG: nucleotide exchange factor GrpE [Phycisphaeraceae bacterium]